MANQDVIIIGAGHNGLVTAANLAKAGKRVLVLERRAEVGGAAVTEELFPGTKVSTCADGGGYLAPEIAKELKLDAHGLVSEPIEAVAFVPQPDGTSLTIWRDTARTAAEIERFSPADAKAWPAFVELMQMLADAVGGLLRITPPDVPDIGWQDLPSLKTLAGPIRRLGRKNVNQLLRILPMPAADLLDEWFESGVVKGAVAANGVRDITWGPREAGTAYTLLYRWALSDSGLFRSASSVKGGIGSITQALARAARDAGAEIRTGTEVERVLLEDDRARGVVLAGGEEIRARIVVSNANPRTTFNRLVEPRRLAADVVRHVRSIKFRGTGARIHLVLRGLPAFTAIGGEDTDGRLHGAIQIAPDMIYLQRAYDHVKYGEYSEHPYLDVRIPTLTDPALAPEGQHVLSMTVKYAPYALRSGDWEAHRQAFTDNAIATLEAYAPGVRELVSDARTLLPCDLESEFGLPEGNGNHGEMTLDQFLHMRPIPGYARYASPVDGLYLCGAGSHPGGGVTGIPGQNAAREILRGWK